MTNDRQMLAVARHRKEQRPVNVQALALPSRFRSLLFPPESKSIEHDRLEPPDCFSDLNLDQVVEAIVAKHDQSVLRPIFYSYCRNEHTARFRHTVFADLEQPATLQVFPPFRDSMRIVRANLEYAAKITSTHHRNAVILRAINRYCDAIDSLTDGLRSAPFQSPGLQAFLRYLNTYASSRHFASLAAEARDLRSRLSDVNYGMLFRGDRVTVRKYAFEVDYATTILERFAKFRENEIEPAPLRPPRDDFSLNHIEEAIFDFVGELFPDEFRALSEFTTRELHFIDETLALADREIGFYLAYLAFIEPLRAAGLPFCYPTVSTLAKDAEVSRGFDIALAAKLTKDSHPVICNDFYLRDVERLIVVSGPNQGGKTTFARMFGQLHYLAGLGCPIPGKNARLFLPDHIFTHFEREEDITNLRGKLEDELVHLHRTCQEMTSDSLVVLNEIFNSTSLDDQICLSKEILLRMLATDTLGVCVTFLDALSTLNEKTVSMVSTVDPDDPAVRTFEIVRRPADGLAYALSLAAKRHVTYAQLRERIRP